MKHPVYYTVNAFCVICEMNEIYSEEKVDIVMFFTCDSFLRKCVCVSYNYGCENRTVNLLVEGKFESDEMKLLKYQ